MDTRELAYVEQFEDGASKVGPFAASMAFGEIPVSLAINGKSFPPILRRLRNMIFLLFRRLLSGAKLMRFRKIDAARFPGSNVVLNNDHLGLIGRRSPRTFDRLSR